MVYYSIELLFSMIRYMYILFHTQIYVYLFMYFYFIVTVSAEMDLSTQLLLLSYSSPLLSSPLLSSLDKWINHPSAALRVLLHYGD